MPKSTLTWYKTKANKIVRMFNLIPQKEIAETLNISQQAVSYKIRCQYPKTLAELIQVLDMAGYEIREKGDEE